MVLCNIRIPTLALFISLGYLIASINIVLAAPVDEGTLQSIYARLQDPRGVQPQQPQISPPNHQEAASVYWIRLFAVLHGRLEQKVAFYMFQMRRRATGQGPPGRFEQLTPDIFWGFIISVRGGFQPGPRVGLDVPDMRHMLASETEAGSAERMMRARTEPPGAFILTVTNYALHGTTPAFLSRRWEVPKARPDVIWNRELNALFAEILKSVLEYRHWEDQMESHVIRQPPSDLRFTRTLAECWGEIMVDISRFIAENNQAGRTELANEWAVKLEAARHARQSNMEPPNPGTSYPIIRWRSPGGSTGVLFDPFSVSDSLT